MKPGSTLCRKSSLLTTLPARLLVCALVVLPAWSQARLDADSMKMVGGTYSVDCANPAAMRLQVTADALLIEQGSQRIVGRNVEPSYSFYGNSPPKDYSVALMSEAKGGVQVLFIVYSDKTGNYILIDGDPKVHAAVGKAMAAARHRQCDRQGAPMVATASPAQPAPAAMPAPAAATGGVPDLYTLISDKKFKRTYLRSIGPKASERWLTQMDGPAPPTRAQTVEGVPYIVIAICKSHDCYDNNAVFLYSAEQDRVLGLIQQSNVKTLVGLPPPSVGAQLDRMWQAEFRQR